MKVGIIGGGVGGLTAGYELVKRGHQVAIFERGPILGGQASTFNVGGGRLERAYHHLFTSDTHMTGLIEELGLKDRLVWIASKTGFLYKDRIYPFVTAGDLLRFTPVSFLDRVRMGLVTVYLQKRYKLNDPKKRWLALEKYTAKEWMMKWAGKRNYEVIWGPLLRGKFGSSADEISMVWLWSKFATRVTSRKGLAGKEMLGYPIKSFGEIMDTLEARIRQAGGEIYTRASVNRVVVKDGRAWGLEVQLAEGAAQERPFDKIVATVPSFVFLKLAPGLPEDYAAKLKAARYHAAVLMVLVMDRPLSHIYWLNISDRSIPFVAAIEHTNYISPDHYGGKHIVYLSNYLGRESEYYFMQPDQLFEAYLPHLRKINPQFDPSWVLERYYHREDAAQPIITTHYSQKIPPLKTPIPDLYLGNTTQIYPEDRGTNYSVRLGKELVEAVLAG